MREIRYTLLADGSSDRALLPILTWLLQTHLPTYATQAQWADLRRLNQAMKETLARRIQTSLDLYPCDLLFIHRDAEKESRQKRVEEIYQALEQVKDFVSVPVTCVIPVRMTEAWLLFHEVAIRRAASNPNGRTLLEVPVLKSLEEIPDPKQLLYGLLRQASELSSRRLKKFRESERVHRIAELIDDFSPLRQLNAFTALEQELKTVIEEQRWL
jgi:hypothetical protein